MVMGWGARGPEAWLMLLMDISADDIPDENDVLAKGTIVRLKYVWFCRLFLVLWFVESR